MTRDPRLRIYHLDARNHVNDLLGRKRAGEAVPAFDLIYGDAFNHYAAPHHLTALEFNRELAALLAPEGIYLIHVGPSSACSGWRSSPRTGFPRRRVAGYLAVLRGPHGLERFHRFLERHGVPS